MTRKNLVLAAVGDESHHESWLRGAETRSFDLALVYFGEQRGRYARQAEFYFERQGIKYELLHALAGRELAEVLPRYDYVWIPDDDIAADLGRVNRLFEFAREYRLEICQPAISRGDVSYRALLARPEFLLRYSRFAEIMCPLFSRAALARAVPIFNANRSAWGIDWVWSSWFGPEEIAVIDACPVEHMRPIRSGGVHTQLQSMGVDPMRDLTEILARHGVDNRRFHRATCRGTARVRGIRLDGTKAWTRPPLTGWLSRRTAERSAAEARS